jgi:DDE superfamily endonuclease
VEYLPSYAPDLNPVEGLWANLKDVELANRACRSLEELAAAAEQGLGGCGASRTCCSRSSIRQNFPYEYHIILRDSVATQMAVPPYIDGDVTVHRVPCEGAVLQAAPVTRPAI